MAKFQYEYVLGKMKPNCPEKLYMPQLAIKERQFLTLPSGHTLSPERGHTPPS